MDSSYQRDLIYANIRDALKVPGCPICHIGASAATRYLRFLLHENVNSVTTRINIHKAWGFCSEHAWELKQMEEDVYKDALGYPIILEGLINSAITISNELKEQLLKEICNSSEGGLFRKKRDPLKQSRENVARLRPSGPCPACKAREETSKTHSDFLMRYISIDEFREMYIKSEGLCLKHFALCIENAENPEDIVFLIDSQLAIWSNLSDELAEHIRKMDYRYSKEPKGPEQDAWIKAIRVTSGNHVDFKRKRLKKPKEDVPKS
ncbi:MAG: hypothetical protein HPY50_21030 [Firmicutes bacterium]|nr:hypothetical protein [Bacillota bacterium]